MFLINSRLRNGSCGPSPLRVWGRSYPEVTTTFLPSSFRSFHTFTLAHLRQPTCVGLRYGLIPLISLRLFPEECLLGFPALRRVVAVLPNSPCGKEGYTTNKNPITRPSYYSSSFQRSMEQGGGILTSCPSLRHILARG